MAKVNVYIMRHGQTILNAMNRMQGWIDSPLTQKGKVESLESGKGLSHIKFDAFYTSDLQRTWETLYYTMLLNKQHTEITYTPMIAFREVNYGCFEGEVAENIFPSLNKEISENNLSGKEQLAYEVNYFNAEIQGEPELYDNYIGRVRTAIKKISSINNTEQDSNILIVTHGMTILNLLYDLIPDFHYEGFQMKNAGLTLLEYTKEEFVLKTFNSNEHFQSLTQAEKDNVFTTKKTKNKLLQSVQMDVDLKGRADEN